MYNRMTIPIVPQGAMGIYTKLNYRYALLVVLVPLLSLFLRVKN